MLGPAAIRKKSLGFLWTVVLHDNAGPHGKQDRLLTAVIRMEHAPYSPDLAPGDYHMFSLLKFLAGQMLISDDMKSTVRH
jgi:hypothetical protein